VTNALLRERNCSIEQEQVQISALAENGQCAGSSTWVSKPRMAQLTSCMFFSCEAADKAKLTVQSVDATLKLVLPGLHA
jgi:hypothetical protein